MLDLFGKSVRGITIFVAVAVVCLPISAFAQNSAEDDAAAASIVTTSTTTTGLGLTIGGIVTTVLLVQDDDQAAHWERYIRNNAVALGQDITLGGGSTTQDLAHIFGVPKEKQAAFGQLLRSNRQTLLPLTDIDRLNEERAMKFANTLYAALKESPAFAEEARRLKPYFDVG